MSLMNNINSQNGAHMPGTSQHKEKINPPAKLLLSAAVFGVAFSSLFTKQNIGLNMLIFVLLVYAFALFNRTLFVKKTFQQEPLIYLLSVPVLFLGASLFMGSTVLDGLSVLGILFVLFVQYLVLSDNALYRWDQPGFIADLFFGGLNRLLFSFGHFIAGAVNKVFKHQSDKRKGAAIGVFIGLGLLIVIVPILMLSDPNVMSLVNLFFVYLDIGDIFLYLFVFFIGASLIMGPVATANKGELTGTRTARNSTCTRPIEGVTAGVALSMISVVYVLFGALQFSYFFETNETIASVLGLTRSAYAVRGFGELLFVTCLNFFIIALSMRFTAQKQEKSNTYLKVLYTLLVVFNFVILASSHLRMQSYEVEFGHSVARFLSHSFMVLLMILNGVMLVRIYYDKLKALRIFMIALLLYFCTIVAINPELHVAKSNIHRYEETQEIDMEYLFGLSSNAVSEACDFAETHPEAFDDNAKVIAESRYDRYAYALRKEWPSLNIADRTAYTKLKQLLH